MSKNLIDLPLPPEGQHIEYKRVSTQPEMLARAIASFANAEGGKIVVGVDDDLSIVGLSDEEIRKTQIALEKAKRLLRPRSPLDFYFEEIEEKILLTIVVQRHSTPVLTANGRYYVRKGAVSNIEEETLLDALAGAVPTAKPNILTSLGIDVEDTVRVEETVRFKAVGLKPLDESSDFFEVKGRLLPAFVRWYKVISPVHN